MFTVKYNYHSNMTKHPYSELQRESAVCTVLAVGGSEIRIPRRCYARTAAGGTSSTPLQGNASSGGRSGTTNTGAPKFHYNHRRRRKETKDKEKTYEDVQVKTGIERHTEIRDNERRKEDRGEETKQRDKKCGMKRGERKIKRHA
jgi:hypothetical protein